VRQLVAIRPLRKTEASYRRSGRCPAKRGRCTPYAGRSKPTKEFSMPVILWLLGVPLIVVLLLMFFHVI
jgi:hypothetical protein